MKYMKLMNTSTIYTMLNKALDVDNQILKVMGMKKEMYGVTPQSVELPLTTIRTTFKTPFTRPILDALGNGTIILSYREHVPGAKVIPSSVPFITYESEGKLRSLIFLDIIGTKKGTYIEVDPKKLYVTMQTALMTMYIYLGKVQPNTRTYISTSIAMSSLIYRILDKEFALNTDKLKQQKVQYISGMYALSNLFKMDPMSDAVKNYARNAVVRPNVNVLDYINNLVITEINRGTNPFENLSTIINFLKLPELELGFGERLSLRGFISSSISLYGPASQLMYELLPYFLYNITSVDHAAYLNNHIALDDILGNETANIINSLRF